MSRPALFLLCFPSARKHTRKKDRALKDIVCKKKGTPFSGSARSECYDLLFLSEDTLQNIDQVFLLFLYRLCGITHLLEQLVNMFEIHAL